MMTINLFTKKFKASALTRKWRAAHPEATKERNRIQNLKRKRMTPIQQRRADYKRRYGISLEGFDAMLAKQGGVCGMCNGEHKGKGKQLHVDHCHKTGKVRGLLCGPCNVGLGHYEKIGVLAGTYLADK